jgi:CheY-like chemotaxis protein/GAF domain-containing protein
MATILVVDDNTVNRKLLVALLSGDGHLTLEASDGLDGLRVAHAHPPQLIISDILMPSMDGYGFVRALRADPNLSATPVIFYTAHYHEREALKLARECGVTRVLIKPCRHDDLLKAIEQAMAGVSESDPDTLHGDFTGEHLLLLTNKLSERADALAASNSRFAALAELTLEIASEQDPRALVERVCSGARYLIGAVCAVLAIAEETSSRGLFFATSGIDFGGAPPPPPALGAGPLGSVFINRVPWRASISNGQFLDAGLPSGYPAARAFLGVPVMTASRVHGWLCLADKIGADAFDAEDESFLSILGSLVGRAYENINFHVELQAYCAKLRLSAEQSARLVDSGMRNLNRAYAVLGGINSVIARTRDRAELCKEACRLATREGRFRLAFIETFDSGSGETALFAAADDIADVEKLARRMSAESIAQEDLLALALSSQRPAVCNDLAAARPGVRLGSEMLDRGYRAIAALPLNSGGEILGRLVVLTEEADFFDDAELRLLTEMAGGVSAALANRAKAVAA